MGTLTIPDVDDDLKRWLEVRAAEHGHSIEAEVSGILRSALAGGAGEPAPVGGNLAEAIRAIVEPLGGIALDIPPRQPIREPQGSREWRRSSSIPTCFPRR